jgi:hypothetical protein
MLLASDRFGKTLNVCQLSHFNQFSCIETFKVIKLLAGDVPLRRLSLSPRK